MPRRYGPGHFTEDPYSHIVSPHGIPVDDLVAVLQKEIRRGHVDNAVLAAYEMIITSADVAEHLWRRLRLIAVEDVGTGLPMAPVLIDVLHRSGGDWMMACHAVRLLATAPKDRTSAEHADWVVTKVALGEALVEVPDYAHCVHTRAGQELGRGLVQWWENGAQVRDELPTADHRYRDELIEIHRRDEAENGTAPGSSRWFNAGMSDLDQNPRVVSAHREIAASASTIFELIADPTQQPRWDGNDNLAEAPTGQRVRAEGDVFRVTLTKGNVRENHVVEFDEHRRIAWRPAEPGQQPPGHLWRWELEPIDTSHTRVTHTYDWTQLTDEKRLPRARATTADKLRASLDRLAALAERD